FLASFLGKIVFCADTRPDMRSFVALQDGAQYRLNDARVAVTKEYHEDGGFERLFDLKTADDDACGGYRITAAAIFGQYSLGGYSVDRIRDRIVAPNDLFLCIQH